MRFVLAALDKNSSRKPHASRWRVSAPALLGICLSLSGSPSVSAQIVCHSASGPDVVVADLITVHKWGTVNGITGYSIGSLACNVGDTPLEWRPTTNRHPVIAQNAYRLRNGRFEQLGMSWVKHGFEAEPDSACCTCQDPGTNTLLGVGCSDAYDANLNGLQQGFNGMAGLGPRSEVNPASGFFLFPYGHQGEAGDSIYKRLQIHNDDLDPAQNAGALYFGELQYVAPDDAEAGNDLNNVTYMPISVGALQNGGYLLNAAGAPRPTLPAIYAWQEFDGGVTITPIDVPGDGRLILASKITDLGNGQWQYEYAIFNQTSHRAARQFRIPLPPDATVTNIGFHDVDYHSGEPFDGTNWPHDVSVGASGGALTWATSTFANDPNANALRWGTLYNFRFRADTPPVASVANIALFRPPTGGGGQPDSVNVSAPGPMAKGGSRPPNDDCANATSVGIGSTAFTTDAASTDGPAFACAPAGGASHDVWFRFTPTFSGRCRISTCGSAAFDSIIAVHQGCGCGGALGPVLRCSDNGCGTDGKVVLSVQAGQCYLIRVGAVDSGPPPGVATLKIAALDADNAINANRILTGEAAGDRFGQSVAFAGDFTGSGGSDVIVGAYLSDNRANNAGRAYVGLGAAFTTSVGFSGEQTGDTFGKVVAGGCDFDGDGYDDIVVGAPLADDTGTDAGKVYCFSGFDNSVLWIARGQAAGDHFGAAVACVGDINGDAAPDVLVGAPLNDIPGTSAGRAYILAGQDGSVIQILNGKAAGDQFGTAVCGLGDVNDDGVNDFAVAAPRNKQGGAFAGRVVIYDGATRTSMQILLGGAGDRFGSALAGVTMPVGAQTRSYLAVGSPGNGAAGAGAGQVRLFMRNHTGPQCQQPFCSTVTINGRASGELFGSAVDVGDVAQGAPPEVLVGAPGSSANGAGSGAAYVLNAANGAQIRRITGETAGDAFGTALAVTGDFDIDGKEDFIVGAPANDAAGTNAGRAYVFFSQSSALLMAQAMAGGGALADVTGAGDEPADDTSVFIRPLPRRDVNGDRQVNAEDVLAVIQSWGRCRPGPCAADVNHDGEVNAQDLRIILGGE